jgi:hypothetical protein
MALLEDKLAKTEGDLRALSQAYTALDEHSGMLQQKLDEHSKKASLVSGLDEAAIEDLLVCLGQEEQENAALRAELDQLKFKT